MVPAADGLDIIKELHVRGLLVRTIILTVADCGVRGGFEDGQLAHRLIRKPFDLEQFITDVLALTPIARAAQNPAVGGVGSLTARPSPSGLDRPDE